MSAASPAFSLARHGLVFTPPSGHALWASHAQAPTVLPLDEATWRVFLAGRDGHNVSRIFAVDLDPASLTVRHVHPDPVLDVGAPGAFDAHGIGPGTALWVDGRVRLYFMGLQRQADIPYRPNLGVAESTDGGLTFTRVTPEPLLSPSPALPLGAALPTVLREGDGWLMWFSHFTEWADVDGKAEPVYDLACATSPDGLAWTHHPDVSIPLADDDEGGLVRPALRRTEDGWLMLFSARAKRDFRTLDGARYRLVAATSPDGRAFTRRPGPTLTPPPGADDWDGQMQAYPAFAEHGGRTVLLYNGNAFGTGGFGAGILTGTP